MGEGIYEEFGYQKAGEKRIGWKLVSGQESEFQVGPFLIRKKQNLRSQRQSLTNADSGIALGFKEKIPHALQHAYSPMKPVSSKHT